VRLIVATSDISEIDNSSAPQNQRFTGWQRFLIVILVITAVFALTYTMAWFDASRLSLTYMQNAEASYQAGNYLEALNGYEEFDTVLDDYVTYGGYTHVEDIWSHPNAWPTGSNATHAKMRIDEIINEHLTVDTAEQFVQENIGKPNAYMGPVFLRMGELYEEEGDSRSAKQIYREVEDLFPNHPELITRAEAHLTRLEEE